MAIISLNDSHDESKHAHAVDHAELWLFIAHTSMRCVWMLLFAVLCVGTCPAQKVIRKPTVRVKLEPNLVRVNKQPPIAFKPFDMLDPKTKKPVAPTATITLPNGKTATAKEYYDQLNEFEKWLNENGYSMRTAPPNSRTKIAELIVDRARLERQRQMAPKSTAFPRRTDLFSTYSHDNLSTPRPIRIEPSHVSTERLHRTVEPRTIESVNQRFATAGIQGVTLDGMVINASTLAWIANENLSNILKIIGGGNPPPPPPPPQPQCTLINPPAQSWNWNYGDPSTFYAYTEATLSLGGLACKPPDMQNFAQNNPSSFLVTAEGKGGGTVFGAGGDLIRASGNMAGNQSNNTVTGNLDVFVVGQNVLNIHKTENAGWGAQDNLSYPVDFSAEVPIPLGPIDIDATLGAQGSVGLQYSVSLSPISSSFSATPSVHTAAYAEIGVGVYIGSVGVYGSLNPILDWNMNLHGDAGIGWLFGWYAYDDLYADTNLNMLAGDFGVYLKAGVCPFCHEWDFSIWSEPGLQFNAVLINADNKIPLNW